MPREIEYREDFVGNFRLLNFATGSYACTCCICGEHFVGDKRAVQCLSCALKTVKEKECQHRFSIIGSRNVVKCTKCQIEYEVVI